MHGTVAKASLGVFCGRRRRQLGVLRSWAALTARLRGARRQAVELAVVARSSTLRLAMHGWQQVAAAAAARRAVHSRVEQLQQRMETRTVRAALSAWHGMALRRLDRHIRAEARSRWRVFRRRRFRACCAGLSSSSWCCSTGPAVQVPSARQAAAATRLAVGCSGAAAAAHPPGLTPAAGFGPTASAVPTRLADRGRPRPRREAGTHGLPFCSCPALGRLSLFPLGRMHVARAHLLGFSH